MKRSIFVCVSLVIIPSGKTELGKENVISDWPSRRQKIILPNHSFYFKEHPEGSVVTTGRLEGRKAVWQKKKGGHMPGRVCRAYLTCAPRFFQLSSRDNSNCHLQCDMNVSFDTSGWRCHSNTNYYY